MHRTVERMLRTNPEPTFAPSDMLAAVIHACIECSQVCTACADACIAEHMDQLDHCIRVCMDCADICDTTGRILSRQQSPDLSLIGLVIELCATACEAAATECERHAMHHAHCHVAATACHRAYETCRMMMTGPVVHQLH